MIKKHIFIFLLYSQLICPTHYQLSKNQQYGVFGLITAAFCSWLIYNKFFHRHREIFKLKLTKDKKWSMCRLFDVLDASKSKEINIAITNKIILYVSNININGFFEGYNLKKEYWSAFDLVAKKLFNCLSEQKLKTVLLHGVIHNESIIHLIRMVAEEKIEFFLKKCDKDNNNLLHLFFKENIQHNSEQAFNIIFQKIGNNRMYIPNKQGETFLFLVTKKIIETNNKRSSLPAFFIKYGIDPFRKCKQNEAPFDLVFTTQNKDVQLDLLWNFLIGDKIELGSLFYADDVIKCRDNIINKEFELLNNDQKFMINNHFDPIKDMFHYFENKYIKEQEYVGSSPVWIMSEASYIQSFLLYSGFCHLFEKEMPEYVLSMDDHWKKNQVINIDW